MKINKLILALLILTFNAISCKTERIELTGSIVGNVITYDKFGYMLQNEITNITIKEVDISANTNSSGFYQINNIPAGTYTIKYKSPNTEEYIKRGVQIIGGEKPTYIEDAVLAEKSTGIVTNLRIETSGFMQFIFGDIDVPGVPTYQQKVVLYISSSSNVSKENYDFSEYTTPNLEGLFVFDLPYSYYGSGIENIYVVAYATTYIEHSWNCDEYNFCIDPCVSDIPSETLALF